MALFLDLLQGEWIDIEDGLYTIHVLKKSGRKVRLRIVTSQEATILIGRKREDDMRTPNSSHSRDHP